MRLGRESTGGAAAARCRRRRRGDHYTRRWPQLTIQPALRLHVGSLEGQPRLANALAPPHPLEARRCRSDVERGPATHPKYRRFTKGAAAGPNLGATRGVPLARRRKFLRQIGTA